MSTNRCLATQPSTNVEHNHPLAKPQGAKQRAATRAVSDLVRDALSKVKQRGVREAAREAAHSRVSHISHIATPTLVRILWSSCPGSSTVRHLGMGFFGFLVSGLWCRGSGLTHVSGLEVGVEGAPPRPFMRETFALLAHPRI